MPAHFEENRLVNLHELIVQHPLGALVTLGADGLVANHIPFLIDTRFGEHGSLIGHVARNNRVWHDHRSDTEAMVIFQGPSSYISPNWYPTKQEAHEVVPTYNYVVVHVYGKIIVHEDPKWLRGVIGKLTKVMEAAQSVPWKMADAPATFLDSQIENIVGIEIPISRMLGKWKTSQNRVPADREGAIAGLRESGDSESLAMADLIERVEGIRSRERPRSGGRCRSLQSRTKD
ncbi:MAG: FMN-binding negative transcriptional regulator [Thermomicrobiales bacterium]